MTLELLFKKLNVFNNIVSWTYCKLIWIYIFMPSVACFNLINDCSTYCKGLTLISRWYWSEISMYLIIIVFFVMQMIKSLKTDIVTFEFRFPAAWPDVPAVWRLTPYFIIREHPPGASVPWSSSGYFDGKWRSLIKVLGTRGLSFLLILRSICMTS